MTILIALTAALFLAYALVILRITSGWLSLKAPLGHAYSGETRVSVIIPFRNEAGSLANIIQDLAGQDYPMELFEVLLSDDFSTDESAEVAMHALSGLPHLKARLVQSEKEGKKAAVSRAVHAARGRLVLCTDADCRVGKSWISTFVSYYESCEAKMIMGPVLLSPARGFFTQLQSLEFMSLICSAAGSSATGRPIMANGANLAYERDAFSEVNGYEGNEDYASGDDVFLLMKMTKHYGSKAVRFLKAPGATVTTCPHTQAGKFLSQRLRWVSKSKAYSDAFTLSVALTVFATNAALAFFSVAALFSQRLATAFLIFYTLKLCIDLPSLFSTAVFFRKKRLLVYFPLLEIINAFYTAGIAIAGNLLRPEWKGRRVS